MALTTTLGAPLPHRARRSHAERRAETCARIKQATVESITEVGFHRTTAAEISKRSGVSWGAAQHHFGDKEGILAAVLVDSFNLLVGELEGLPREGACLEERVGVFVDAAWSHMGSPHYRCTFEILLNMPTWERAAGMIDLREDVLRLWFEIWDRFFGDPGLPPDRRIALQYYVVCVMSGLSAMTKFEQADAERRQLQLGFLKNTLLHEMGAGAL